MSTRGEEVQQGNTYTGEGSTRGEGVHEGGREYMGSGSVMEQPIQSDRKLAHTYLKRQRNSASHARQIRIAPIPGRCLPGPRAENGLIPHACFLFQTKLLTLSSLLIRFSPL